MVPEFDGSPILFTYSVDGEFDCHFFCGLVNVSLLLRLANIFVRNLPSPRNWDLPRWNCSDATERQKVLWMTFYHFSQHSALSA